MSVAFKNKPQLDAALRQAGFTRNDTLVFKVSRKKVTIVPRSPDDDTVLTPEEAKIVRRGEAQLRRGQSKSWRDVKHALER